MGIHTDPAVVTRTAVTIILRSATQGAFISGPCTHTREGVRTCIRAAGAVQTVVWDAVVDVILALVATIT